MKLTHTRFESLAPAARPTVVTRERVRSDNSRASAPPEGAAAVADAEEPSAEAGPEQIAKVEDAVNEMFANGPVRVSIARDDESGRVVVRMYDEDDQILSQFPSEDLLRTAEHLEGMRGLLFEGKG